MEKRGYIKFNETYKLQINENPTLLDVQRLKDFKNILLEEVGEADDIIKMQNNVKVEEQKLDVLVEIADWLCDIIWYCQSEAIKYGIDADKVLDIINESNLSKLDKNGHPIYDERGKVLRGQNYFKPETKIKEFLKQ